MDHPITLEYIKAKQAERDAALAPRQALLDAAYEKLLRIDRKKLVETIADHEEDEVAVHCGNYCRDENLTDDERYMVNSRVVTTLIAELNAIAPGSANRDCGFSFNGTLFAK